jgi:hypothetical protein
MRRIAQWQKSTWFLGITLLFLLSMTPAAQSQQEGFTSLPVIEDATGQIVGVILELTTVYDGTIESQNKTALFDAGVLLQIKGIPTLVRITPKKITGFPSAEVSDTRQLNFDGPNCTGAPFVRGTTTARFGGRALFYDGRLFLPKPKRGVYRELASHVVETATGDFVCENSSYPDEYTEARAVALSLFDRFIPPFAIRGLPSLP